MSILDLEIYLGKCSVGNFLYFERKAEGGGRLGVLRSM